MEPEHSACKPLAKKPMPTAVLAAERLASLAKPPGSLGTLEEWAATLCTVQGTLTPAAAPQTVLVFCAYLCEIHAPDVAG